MNERIKELANQAAKEYHAMLNPATHSIPNFKVTEIAEDAKTAGVAIIPHDFCDTFARLIILKCADLVKNFHNEDISDSAAQIIKEHFGVE